MSSYGDLYRRPFAEPGEGGRPTLTWPRQIPFEGEPADVHAIETEYADWLGTSNVPKLFLKAEPGAILTNDTLINLVRGWPALTEKTVAGIHFVQEDSLEEIEGCHFSYATRAGADCAAQMKGNYKK
jgi:haloalkane dehalogenase